MAEIKVTTRLMEDYWRCYADTPNLGKVVVSQDRTSHRAQYRAAQCMDANFPDDNVVWVDPYEGGDTENSFVPSVYWKERNTKMEPQDNNYEREVDEVRRLRKNETRPCFVCDKPTRTPWGETAVCSECDEHAIREGEAYI